MQSLADFLGVGQPDAVRDGPDHPDPMDALVDGTASLQEFAQKVLCSREYRLSVLQRIQLGELPPAIERWLYELAVPKKASDLPTGESMIVEIRRVLVQPAFAEDEESKVTH